MSLAEGLYADRCCKLGDKGSRCRPFCVLAGIDLPAIVLYLRAYRDRVAVQARAVRDSGDRQDAYDLIVEIGLQIAALEEITK